MLILITLREGNRTVRKLTNPLQCKSSPFAKLKKMEPIFGKVKMKSPKKTTQVYRESEASFRLFSKLYRTQKDSTR
jgi:hypothetical protein